VWNEYHGGRRIGRVEQPLGGKFPAASGGEGASSTLGRKKTTFGKETPWAIFPREGKKQQKKEGACLSSQKKLTIGHRSSRGNKRRGGDRRKEVRRVLLLEEECCSLSTEREGGVRTAIKRKKKKDLEAQKGTRPGWPRLPGGKGGSRVIVHPKKETTGSVVCAERGGMARRPNPRSVLPRKEGLAGIGESFRGKCISGEPIPPQERWTLGWSSKGLPHFGGEKNTGAFPEKTAGMKEMFKRYSSFPPRNRRLAGKQSIQQGVPDTEELHRRQGKGRVISRLSPTRKEGDHDKLEGSHV